MPFAQDQWDSSNFHSRDTLMCPPNVNVAKTVCAFFDGFVTRWTDNFGHLQSSELFQGGDAICVIETIKQTHAVLSA